MVRNRLILQLALPSIVSNITVPLLGLVDVAIVGHMGGAVYIGAISVGAMVFNIIYWIFGFLRMGTSGMTSQALGRRNLADVLQLLCRSVAVAIAVAMTILILQVPIKWLAFLVVNPEKEVMGLASSYFDICVWGAPAMLVLYSLSGWFVGMQNTRIPMMISIIQNVVNILASLTLVYGCGMKVEGVACGTLFAQYVGCAIAIILWAKVYGRLTKHFVREGLLDFVKMLEFFKVNYHIFLRTLCLVAVNLFFLAAGARQGAVMLAVNTLLVQLYILFSYFLDGFAFAGEALCGRYHGAANSTAFKETVRLVFAWGGAIAIVFTLIYAIGGQWFLNVLTDERSVAEAAVDYLPWAVAVPKAGVAAIVCDGGFIGVTATKGMLLSSVVATIVFFSVYLIGKDAYANHALWLAFVAFLITRGIVQTIIYSKGFGK